MMKKRLSFLFLVNLLSFGKAVGTTETVNMTAYTSEVRQTDSTPFITSIGYRVRYGIVAASPDLIRKYGYHARVIIKEFSKTRGCGALKTMMGTVFIIQDATSSRKVKTLDIWMPNRNSAINFGRCVARVQILPSR